MKKTGGSTIQLTAKKAPENVGSAAQKRKDRLPVPSIFRGFGPGCEYQGRAGKSFILEWLSDIQLKLSLDVEAFLQHARRSAGFPGQAPCGSSRHTCRGCRWVTYPPTKTHIEIWSETDDFQKVTSFLLKWGFLGSYVVSRLSRIASFSIISSQQWLTGINSSHQWLTEINSKCWSVAPSKQFQPWTWKSLAHYTPKSNGLDIPYCLLVG